MDYNNLGVFDHLFEWTLKQFHLRCHKLEIVAHWKSKLHKTAWIYKSSSEI